MLIDTASGTTVADVTTDSPISDYGQLAFDPTGSTVAVSYDNFEDQSAPAVELYDVASSELVGSLTGAAGFYCCGTSSTRRVAGWGCSGSIR